MSLNISFNQVQVTCAELYVIQKYIFALKRVIYHLKQKIKNKNFHEKHFPQNLFIHMQTVKFKLEKEVSTEI